MESACCKMLCCIMHANDVNANVLMLIRLVSTLIFVGKIESRSLACRCRRCTKLFVTTQFFYFGRLLKINLFSVTTVILFLFWAFTENKFIFSNTYYFVSESAYAETRNTSFRCIRRHSCGPNTAIAWPAFISPSVTYRPTRRSRASQTSELRIASSKVFGRARTHWLRASPCQMPT